jgi:hypothetical protein
MDDPTCRTCRHWKPTTAVDDGLWGNCFAIDDVRKPLHVRAFVLSREPVTFVTAEDFGCIEHLPWP